jgi:hypothetical protein
MGAYPRHLSMPIPHPPTRPHRRRAARGPSGVHSRHRAPQPGTWPVRRSRQPGRSAVRGRHDHHWPHGGARVGALSPRGPHPRERRELARLAYRLGGPRIRGCTLLLASMAVRNCGRTSRRDGRGDPHRRDERPARRGMGENCCGTSRVRSHRRIAAATGGPFGGGVVGAARVANRGVRRGTRRRRASAIGSELRGNDRRRTPGRFRPRVPALPRRYIRSTPHSDPPSRGPRRSDPRGCRGCRCRPSLGRSHRGRWFQRACRNGASRGGGSHIDSARGDLRRRRVGAADDLVRLASLGHDERRGQ